MFEIFSPSGSNINEQIENANDAEGIEYRDAEGIESSDAEGIEDREAENYELSILYFCFNQIFSTLAEFGSDEIEEEVALAELEQLHLNGIPA